MALFRHVASGVTMGETWTFTLHSTGSGTVTAAQAAWSDGIAALWTGQLDAVINTEVECTETSTATIDETTGAQITRVNDDETLAGASAAESLPFQCAVVVSTRSNLATRSGRGRFYLPPLDVTVMDGGRLATDTQGVVLASAQALFAALASGGLAPVLLRRSDMVQTPIVRIDVGNVIDTQRRRRNKLIEVRLSATL